MLIQTGDMSVSKFFRQLRFDLKLWWHERCERLIIEKAKALDDAVVYHALILAGANATTGKYSAQNVCELTFMETLDRWEGR